MKVIDNLSEGQRRYCMSRIKSKNTNTEMVVRGLVHGLGFRYRLHDTKLAGNPDVVFAGRRKVILVHGCFWHRHNCKKGRSMPATRIEFWRRKLEGNEARDKRNMRELRKMGWKVLVVWECQTKKNPEKLAERIVKFLEG